MSEASLWRPKLLVLASGTKDGGGSGFENLVHASREHGTLRAEIVGVVSQHANGGVAHKAKKLGIPFYRFEPHPLSERRYQYYVNFTGVDFVALSGWSLKVNGLDPTKTINIHPGSLPETKGLYGHRVHEKSIELFDRGRGTLGHTAVTMHFVTDEYDAGPVFFRYHIPIRHWDTPESLAAKVNEAERHWQPILTDQVIHRDIWWDGKDPNSLRLRKGLVIDHYVH